MWRAFPSELDQDENLDRDELFVDASLFPAKKEARESEEPSGERERSAWYWSMARVFLSEVIPTLPRQLRSRSLIRSLENFESPNEGLEGHGPDPKRVMGDKACDSDPARKRLRKIGIDLLVPHRKNHRNVNRQDDRLWDRYRRLYIVERTFSWITNYRRIVVRYDKSYQYVRRFLPTGLCHDNIEKMFMRFCNRLLTHKSEES
jgi:hypothetical protein